MRRFSFFILIIAVLIAAFFFMREVKAPTATAPSTPQPVQPIEPATEPEPESRIATEAIPDASDDVFAVSDRIRLFAPAPNTLVSSPFEVRGEAKDVLNNTVHVQIVNQDGAVLIAETARVQRAGDNGYGQFRLALTYEFRHGEEKMLKVFAKDAAGAPQDMLSIPLRFSLTR